MRHRSELIVVLIACVLAAGMQPPSAFGQTGSALWKTYTAADGLATNEGYAIYQDQTGDIWLATDAGVSRFDGLWRTYDVSKGLVSNRVRGILQSRDGRSMWFATLGGVSQLATDASGVQTWNSFTAAATNNMLLDNDVRALLEAQDGRLWFGVGQGIAVYDPQLTGVAAWSHFTEKDGLAPGQVTALLQDDTGAIWAGGVAGVARFDGQRWSDVLPASGLALARINAIVQDRAGDIWFATEGNGVLRLEKATGAWLRYAMTDGLPGNNVWSIWQDMEGDYWFGANFGGVARFDPHKPEGEQWALFSVANSGLVANSVRAIWEDQANGSIWLATTAGLNRYDWRQWRASSIGENGSSPKVFATAEDAEGRLWAGTDTAGLFVHEGDSWLPVGLSEDPNESLAFVSALFFDAQERLWVGTNGSGLFVREQDEWQHVVETTLFEQATIIGIAQQKDGTLWFGGFDGLAQLLPGDAPRAERWRVFRADNGLPSARIQALFVDADDRVWVGTDQGAAVLSRDGWQTYDKGNSLLPTNDVRAITQTSNGFLWFATWASGVARLDPASGQWLNLTVADGLVSNGVVTLLHDQDDAIWIGTDGGISRFDGSTWQTYQEADGLAGGIVTAMYQDSKGIYWLATVGGLRRYQPETRPPWVRISAVNSRPLNHAPVNLTNLDTVTIELAGGDQETDNNDLLFQYRLLPASPQWQPVRSRPLRLNALEVGEYTVEIRARDDAMNYSVPAQVALIIAPPPQTMTLPFVGVMTLNNALPILFSLGLAVIVTGAAIASTMRARRRPREALERKFNPYVSGEPVRRDDLFFGRDEQLKRILTILHNNSVMIHGERRIGKTSLLFQLAARLRGVQDPAYDFAPVLVDLEGTPEAEFFHRLMEEIVELAPVEARAGLDLAFDPAQADYSARDLRRDLRAIIGYLQERTTKTVRVILLLDEVDVMNDYDQLTQQQLRRIFMEQFAQNLGAVVAGVRISKAWDRLESPWYNLFNEIELAPFGREDALALLQEPVKGVYRWNQDALDFVIEHAEGRPYRIQQYALEAVNHMFEGKRTVITLTDVQAAHEVIQRMAES